MTVLTSKLRTSIRRVVQERNLTFRQLRWLYWRMCDLGPTGWSVGMQLSLWPDYQREQYIRELIQ